MVAPETQSRAALHDDDVFDRGRVGQCLVGDLFQRHDLSASISAISRDQKPRLCVVDAIAQRFGAEAAKDDVVDGADPGAGEHRDGEFRHEGHVDGDAIALLDAERPEDVGKLRHFAKELEVGERATIARLAFPDDRRLVPAAATHVAIEAVHRDVQLASDEPLRVRRLPVEHLVPAARPLQLIREFRPERFRIAIGLRVDLFVPNAGLAAERRWRGESCDFRGGGRRTRQTCRCGRSSRESCREGYLNRALSPLSAESRQSGAHRGDEIGMRDGTELQERAVMLDRRRRVAGFVGDHREIVVRARVPRLDADGALQQVAGIRAAGPRPSAPAPC